MEQMGKKQGMMSPYASLAVQTLVSGVIMYLVMFVMIDGLDSFYNNLNMVYMTLMMVAPMVVLMILAMKHMFPNKGANVAILAISAIGFLGSFALIRTQTTIGERWQRSPPALRFGCLHPLQDHLHLVDPEIKQLCGNIISSQRQEIDQMKVILQRM